MDRQLCIVHANCQGEPLIKRLMSSPEFAERYRCVLAINHTRDPISDELLGECSLFLHQFLGENWGDLASEVLKAKLPKNARSLCIPNMFFTGYWPLWSNKPGFNYRCSYLDELIDKELAPEETVLLFLHSDIAAKFDLLEMVSKSLEIERTRQTRTPVQYHDVIVNNYQDMRLYNTVNHPGSLLMNHAARGILSELGLALPADGVLESLGEPFPEFEQPVNPVIAEHFGWDFAGPDTEYEIYGRKMTFARYVASYVVARNAGVSDFIGFLQGDYIEI